MARALELDASGKPVDTSTYADLDKAIEAGDKKQSDVFRETTLKRWEFGKRLLAEREANGGKQLPNGRLAELGNELGRSRMELDRRMSLALTYPTNEEVSQACETYATWNQLIKAFPPKREPKAPAEPTNPSKVDDEVKVPKIETSPCGDCGNSFPVSELTEDQEGAYELCPGCLDKDEQLRAEKPWRYAIGEPDEIQRANGDANFQSFKAYADVYCLGLKGEPKKRMQSYLRTLLTEMERGND